MFLCRRKDVEMTKNKELKEGYVEILNEIDDSWINPHHLNSLVKQGLSGIFLTSVRPEYQQAKNKIMIVGREPKSWNIIGKDGGFVGRKSYVDSALDKHDVFFRSQFKKKNSKGRSFHNFTRSVAKKSGEEGLIYSNLFCLSYKKSIPQKSPVFDGILCLSEKLLKIQIKILRPDIIVFANGLSGASVATRRKFFPIDGEDNVCINRENYWDAGLSNKQLWSFDLRFEDQLIKSYRTYHPSSTLVDAAIARDFLIDLLPAND